MTLIDAVIRVVMAYSLPVNIVPAMQTGLLVATTLLMQVVTNVYYIRSGLWAMVHQPYSPLLSAAERIQREEFKLINTSISQRTDGAGAVRRARLQMRALAVGMAVVANAVVLTVARIVNGEFPVADDQKIAFAQVIFVTIVVGLIAWGLLELLERVSPRAATIWLAIAVVFFLVSLIGPFASGENTSSTIVLALMHLGAFTTIVPMMWRSAMLRCD